MTVRTTGAARPLMALVVVGALVMPACKRQHNQEPVVGVQQPPPRMPTEHIGELEDDLQVQPARTTSDARLAQPWADVTPTTQADAGSTKPVRTWTSPAVLIGRKQVWLRDKAIASLRCACKKPESCTPEATKMPNTIAQFGFEASQITDGKLQALVDAAAEFKDKQVAVIADRRVNWQAVDAVLAALRAAGAHPVLAAGSHEGELVDVLGNGTALPEAPTLLAARRAAEPGESVPGGLPSDATALTVLIGSGGVSVEVGRAQGEPAYPEVLGNIVESLVALAQRVRLAAPTITSATVRIDPDVTLEQVIQVIDGLRDTCGKTSGGQACHERWQLFTAIQLQMTGTAPEATKAGQDAPLHLDPAAPSGLHLSDTPDAPAKPAAPGLHLTP